MIETLDLLIRITLILTMAVTVITIQRIPVIIRYRVVRHSLWMLVALPLIAMLPVNNAWVQFPAEEIPTLTVSDTVLPTNEPIEWVAPATASEAVVSVDWMQWLRQLYFVIVSVMVVLIMTSIVRLGQWRRSGRRNRDLQSDVDRLALEMGIRREIRLVLTNKPLSPMTWGVFKPVVMVPAAAVNWSEDVRRSVLIHELIHVKRFDYLTNIAVDLLTAALWFHPLVFIYRRMVRNVQEQSCDAMVTRHYRRADDYAVHLIEVARTLRPTRVRLTGVSLMQTNQLKSRIAHILDGNDTLHRSGLILLIAPLMMLSAASIPVIRSAQGDLAYPAPPQKAVIAEKPIEAVRSAQNEKINPVVAMLKTDVPSILPLPANADYAFSTYFGGSHKGVDLKVKEGTTVYATADGNVVSAKSDGDWGNRVVIEHRDKDKKFTYKTYYGHLKDMKVKSGDKVFLGKVIGTVGSTGKSSGPHLHYAIQKSGNWMDPMKTFIRSVVSIKQVKETEQKKYAELKALYKGRTNAPFGKPRGTAIEYRTVLNKLQDEYNQLEQKLTTVTDPISVKVMKQRLEMLKKKISEVRMNVEVAERREKAKKTDD